MISVNDENPEPSASLMMHKKLPSWLGPIFGFQFKLGEDVYG
jgi:hypothetical protein